MRFLPEPRPVSVNPDCHSRGFSLLETLVALTLLVILTMVVAAIFKHHTTPPVIPEPRQATPEVRPRSSSPSETPALRDPSEIPASPSR